MFRPRLFDAIDKACLSHVPTSTTARTAEINFDIRSEPTYLSQTNDLLADLCAPDRRRRVKIGKSSR